MTVYDWEGRYLSTQAYAEETGKEVESPSILAKEKNERRDYLQGETNGHNAFAANAFGRYWDEKSGTHADRGQGNVCSNRRFPG